MRRDRILAWPAAAAAGCLLTLGIGACSTAYAPPSPPVASGCITDVSPGQHTFTCEGLSTDVSVPAACQLPGCGLVLELHGDTGTGPLLDANTNLMALGAARDFVVVAPTGPAIANGTGASGSTWTQAEDDKLMAIVSAVAAVFRTDSGRTHVTGFSRGGYLAWRLLCQHADRFASAAPAPAGSSPGGACTGVPEVSCPFDATMPGGAPARAIPVLFLIGRTDVPVPYACATRLRDQAIAAWGLGAPQAIGGDDRHTHTRWAGSTRGGLLETFEHAYETVADGPMAANKGHCIPGSPYDPYAPAYAVACAPPNAFTWGEEVIQFFDLHRDGGAPGGGGGY